jgi:ADP-ribosylglycohydrolase
MSKIRDGIYGVIIGDMLGVPVEFMRREALDENPVTGPREHGSHDQPLGAWSDDSSLTLALADALGEEYRLERIAGCILNWWLKKEYTSHGYLFDIGQRTLLSLNQLLKITESGDYEALHYLHFDAAEYTNGNGSLMKILPLYFYLKDKGIELNFKTIWEVSALTHPHIRSAIACFMYLIMLDELAKGETDTAVTPHNAYMATVGRMKAFLETNEEAAAEAHHFTGLLQGDIAELPRNEINSGGYVIETLEASFWCLLTTTSYPDAVLRAVNLGVDTDTTAAVTGGLAGFYYGYEAIPQEWIAVLPKRDEIDQICEKLRKMTIGDNL